MPELLSLKVDCPYCGERFEALVDSSEAGNEYTEDCYVCCRPIIFHCEAGADDGIQLHTRSEDDSF
ncbi:MAG: hypothetical protein ACJAYG_000974 [Oceanicoccus sp.]|jgi:hypothetical protein